MGLQLQVKVVKVVALHPGKIADLIGGNALRQQLFDRLQQKGSRSGSLHSI